MKKVLIQPVRVQNDQIVLGDATSEFTLEDDSLTVKGFVPPKFEGVDFEKLRGKDAKDMFYALAGSNYSSYSNVEFIGVGADEVISYLVENFSDEDLTKINPYKWRYNV